MRVSSTLHLQRFLRPAFAGLIALVVLMLTTPPNNAQTPQQPAEPEWVLVMVEQPGCIYCERWNADVAPEYPITPEGRFAPLRRVDLRHLPDDLTFDSRLVFTPTFVLMADGMEVARLEGYAGEDFFWGLLGRLLSMGDPTWAMQDGTQ